MIGTESRRGRKHGPRLSSVGVNWKANRISVGTMDFDKFFSEATRQGSPFPYQRRLAEAPELPELLQVPTGTGKTAAAILAWLWRRGKWPAKTPRRLVYCLPMRVLVEQTRACAVLWLHRLGRLAGNVTMDDAEQRVLHYEPTWGDPGRIAVATLMGGETDDRWRDHPEHDVILVGTQDMLVSRALNRGYAAWPQDWPIEFGLLNVDALWVMDEVQLMGPARTTSVQLQLFSEQSHTEGFPSRQTLWMSATMGARPGSTDPPAWMKTPEWDARALRVSVEGAREEGARDENDLAHDEFAKRWIAAKQLESHVSTGNQPRVQAPQRGKKKGTGSEPAPSHIWTVDSTDLMDRVIKEASVTPLRTVLVFANRVDRARSLFQALRDRGADPLLLHARFRPRDRRSAEARLMEPAPAGGRIIVATQVLEAGVDLDAQALFTEVCPWPSLVQRLGRLNRRGDQKGAPAPAVVFDVEPPARREGEAANDYDERVHAETSLPYDPAHVDVARQRLREVEAAGGSLSPQALSTIAAPITRAGPVLRRFDLDDFFGTEPDLAGGHTDVSPFVRALDRDVDAYVLWRRLARPADDQPPVHPDELCPVPFYDLKSAFAGEDVWILTLATTKRHGAAWRRARADEVEPGDTVMVDLSAGCYDEVSGWLGKGHADRQPTSWLDRWDSPVPVRAWAKRGVGGEPVFEASRVVDARVDARRACGEDPRSFEKKWMELEAHLKAAERHASEIVRALELPRVLAQAVCTSARWHDVGKALERETSAEVSRPFQAMLRRAGRLESGDPKAGILYAKSNRRGGGSSGFRHEVASALAYLAQASPDDDLVAYLVIAHHGKVRLLPAPWDDDDPVDANGVRAGDRVPAVALPDATTALQLDPSRFLPSRAAPGWQGRVSRLLEQHGPFGLAYLEALVRVADWRAS